MLWGEKVARREHWMACAAPVRCYPKLVHSLLLVAVKQSWSIACFSHLDQE